MYTQRPGFKAFIPIPIKIFLYDRAMKYLIINTDGGARGNPGPAALGVVIATQEGEVLQAFGEYLGSTTNNVAEYTALVRALEVAKKLEGTHLDIRMDSELIIKQMQGVYKIKQPHLVILANQVKVLLKSFTRVSFKHVRREYNKAADAMVNQALDAHAT